jgi:hypothetical protein
MKKTNKENPITTFRKANEARQGAVMKSLKKAQAGIQTNGNPEDMMINKPGSTGGYKKPLEKYKPWEGPVDLITPKIETQSISPNDPYERYRADLNSQKRSLDVKANAERARVNATNKFKTDALNEMYPNYQIAPKKKGGSVKRKK